MLCTASEFLRVLSILSAFGALLASVIGLRDMPRRGLVYVSVPRRRRRAGGAAV
jgi:hypothetical protein